MNKEIENIIKKNLPKERHTVKNRTSYSPKDGTLTNIYKEDDTDNGFNQALSQINTSLIADEVLKVVLEKIEQNQKGQFEDDAGNICWYLDDLLSIFKNNK